jgi:hypothetical protein
MNPLLQTLFQNRSEKKHKNRATIRPALVCLEDRWVPTVTYHGGALMPNVEVQGLYVGDQWLNNSTLFNETGYLEGFLSNVVNSTYMDALTNAGYGVGRGSSTGGKISLASLAAGSTLDDSTLRSWLFAYANNGTLAWPDANRLYVCFVEPNVIVRDGGSTSVGGFRGYHGAFAGPSGTIIHYAVIAYPRGSVNNSSVSFLSDIDSITKTASHEIAEAATDPNIGYSTLGWYDDTLNGEIGDIKNDRVMYVHGYAMQRVINQHDFNMTPSEATSNRAVNFLLKTNGNIDEVVNGVETALFGSDVELSDQGIDNQGHAMIDFVQSNGLAYEYHDQVGWVFLDSNVKSAKAGQGVSYILYNNGTIAEFDDATGTKTTVWTSGAQIDAGTDAQGVNTVGITFTWQDAWEHSDDSGWTFIASGVQSISAGRQGVSDYLTTGGVAHWHTLSGQDVALAGGVRQVTAGTDQFGNYMIDLLYTNGTVQEYRQGTGWYWVWSSTGSSGAASIDKGRLGELDIVFAWSDAWAHTQAGWSAFLGSSATAAV